MDKGSHAYVEDKRNKAVLIYINGQFYPREKAMISIFDSGFILGDGVWEGFRLYKGVIVFINQHLERLYQGAKALDISLGMSKKEIKNALYETINVNKMETDVHIRLMVTRGKKKTPGMDPRLNYGDPTIVILAEYKKADPELKKKGIRLVTASTRRGSPDVLDHKINSHNKINCILANIEAIKANADEALMLDINGFVSTCNSTNFFMIKNDAVHTSTGKYCLNGITRGNFIEICKENSIEIYERDFSLFDVYGADEAFVTGTFAGLVPVIEVDGRLIGDGEPGPLSKKLYALYQEKIKSL